MYITSIDRNLLKYQNYFGEEKEIKNIYVIYTGMTRFCSFVYGLQLWRWLPISCDSEFHEYAIRQAQLDGKKYTQLYIVHVTIIVTLTCTN